MKLSKSLFSRFFNLLTGVMMYILLVAIANNPIYNCMSFLTFIAFIYVSNKYFDITKIFLIDKIVTRIIIICFTVLISGVITFIQPINFDNLPSKNILNIKSTGDKNSLSQGKEVWIDYIIADNRQLALKSLMSYGWMYNGRLVSTGEKSAKLKIGFDKDIKIHFVRHPYSGIAVIDLNGKKFKRIDLFSTKQKYIFVSFDNYLPEKNIKLFANVILFLFVTFILGLISVTLNSYIKKISSNKGN